MRSRSRTPAAQSKIASCVPSCCDEWIVVLGNSRCSTDFRGGCPDPSHQLPPALTLCRSIPCDAFVKSDVSYPQHRQKCVYSLIVGGSNNTHRVSVLKGARNKVELGCHQLGFGQCFTQCPSSPHRKHAAGFGQSAARWPCRPQFVATYLFGAISRDMFVQPAPSALVASLRRALRRHGS